VQAPKPPPFFTTRRVYAAGIAFAVALAVPRIFGMSLFDFAHLMRAKLADAAADARTVTAKEYARRYAQRLRAEAALIPAQEPLLSGRESFDASREVQAERRRILEERADHLERVGEWLLKGDLESMKRQVDENARKAAGNH
jgi:hypothetical protein